MSSPLSSPLMESQAVKVYFIDLDGTLIDSIKAHYAAFNAVFQANGLPIVSFKKFASLFGYFSEEIIRRLFPKLNKKTVLALAEQKRRLFIDNYYKKVRLFPEVNKALAALSRKAILVLESNASRAEIKKVARCCKLNMKHFDLILSKENVKHRKPNPELIKKALELLKKKIKALKETTKTEGKQAKIKIIVVGDSIVDVMLARNAKTVGARAIAVLIKRKGQELQYKRLGRLRPNFLIKSFKDLIKLQV